LFSTASGCPSGTRILSTTIRVTASTPPPAGTETMTLIGWSGKFAALSCAPATAAAAIKPQAAITTVRPNMAQAPEYSRGASLIA
jgi:hypothetical protein